MPEREAANASRVRVHGARIVAACAVVAGLGVAAWLVRSAQPYVPGRGLGYALGVAGGSLMLAMLLYTVRKHAPWLAVLGPLRHWFRFHMVAGIAGPLLVLFHSTFRVGSLNAAVALGSMLLVMSSGIAGRFIYRRIHHGLYGSRATLEQLRTELDQRLANAAPLASTAPAITRELERFSGIASQPPRGPASRAAWFLCLGGRRMLAARRVRALCSALPPAAGAALRAAAHEALLAMQRAAQFAVYERLFSLWHVVHVPFLCLLLVTALVHVVAVHMY